MTSGIIGWIDRNAVISHPLPGSLHRADWQDSPEWTSEDISVDCCDELLISLTAETSPEAGMSVAIRFGENKIWSDWLSFFSWQNSFDNVSKRVKSWATREIDIITIERPIDHVQVRVTKSPRTTLHGLLLTTISNIAVLTDDEDSGDKIYVLIDGERKKSVPKGKIFRSQWQLEKSIAHRACGPTSLAMVLEAEGRSVDVAELAAICYDDEADIYGNWSRLVACAGEYGLWGWIVRMDSLAPAVSHLKAGGSAIFSIAFEKKKLTGAALEKTDGHLVVFRGIDHSGDVICNDPAFADSSGEGVVYSRQEFLDAWLSHGGYAFFFYPRSFVSL